MEGGGHRGQRMEWEGLEGSLEIKDLWDGLGYVELWWVGLSWFEELD